MNLTSTPLIVVAVPELAFVISKLTGETGPAAAGFDVAVTLRRVPVVSELSVSEAILPVGVVDVNENVPDD